MIKKIKNIKLVLYILCFLSLVLPMNFDGYSGKWIFGINYITNLFSMSEGKEEFYWFLYYSALFLLPVAVEIIFWRKSEKGVVSDIVDIIVSTACATVMFCFFISFKNSPAGIMAVIVLHILITTMGCLGLVLKIYYQHSFEALMLKSEKIKCPSCGKRIREGEACACKKSKNGRGKGLKQNSSIDIDL